MLQKLEIHVKLDCQTLCDIYSVLFLTEAAAAASAKAAVAVLAVTTTVAACCSSTFGDSFSFQLPRKKINLQIDGGNALASLLRPALLP